MMAHKYIEIFVLVVVLGNAPLSMSDMSPEVKETIDKGLEAGRVIAEALNDGGLHESLVKFGKNLTPYLKALGPLVDIALGYIPEPHTAELAKIKQTFDEVNNKLDILKIEFNRIINRIDWRLVSGNFEDYEREITSAEFKLNRFYKVDANHTQATKDNFLNTYNYKFDDSLQKLYDEVMRDGRVFPKNILAAVVEQTKNDSKKYETFARGIMQLLLQAIKVEVSAYHIKKYNGQTVEKLEQEWQRKMKDLAMKMEEMGEEIKSNYLKQLKIDADELILSYHSLGNERLKDLIYEFVVEKYEWRYWFVAVYDDMYGYDKHTILVCGGYSLLHRQNKNIVIASHDKTRPSSFSQEKGNKTLAAVDNDIDHCTFKNPTDRARVLVDYVAKKLDHSCDNAALIMAVEAGKRLTYTSLDDHRAHRKISKKKRCCRGLWDSLCKTVYWNYDTILFG